MMTVSHQKNTEKNDRGKRLSLPMALDEKGITKMPEYFSSIDLQVFWEFISRT